MKIGIDCRYLGMSGIGRFLEGIIMMLPKEHSYVYWGNENKIKGYNLKGEILACDTSPFSPKGLFNAPKKLNQCDVFFTPNFIIPYGIKAPVYSTIHDVIFLDDKSTTTGFMDAKIKKHLLKRCSKKSKFIFTVSEFSKSRILHYFPKCQKRIGVVYTGLSNKLMEYQPKALEKRNQIIFVGNLKKNKNIIELLKAFEIVKTKDEAMELLLVGSNDHKTKDEALSKYLTMPGVRFTGRITDEELFDLISESRFLIQPSLYEGFGLPPLEALYLGTRSILNSIEVFKEIYYSFDVIFYEGVEDLANKILTSSYQNVKYSSQHEYQFVKVVEKILNRIEDR